MEIHSPDQLHRNDLTELLRGGFAPNVVLLQEFHYQKAGIVLEGLHFSAWILLAHIKVRHNNLLKFMQDPGNHQEVWPDAHWPENHEPNEFEWSQQILAFEKDLNAMITLVQDEKIDLFKLHKNGKTLSWAAMTALHHTGYHIGQLKVIGRQLGVW